MKQIFAVFDKAAGAFMDPFTLPAKGQAIRGFTDAVNDPTSPVHAHPEDYHLFHLGTFNPDSGEIQMLERGVAEPVIGAIELVQSADEATYREEVRSDG